MLAWPGKGLSQLPDIFDVQFNAVFNYLEVVPWLHTQNKTTHNP